MDTESDLSFNIVMTVELSGDNFLAFYDRFQLLMLGVIDLDKCELIKGGSSTTTTRYINLGDRMVSLYVADFCYILSLLDAAGDFYSVKYLIPSEKFNWEFIEYGDDDRFSDDDVIDFIVKYGQGLIEI